MTILDLERLSQLAREREMSSNDRPPVVDQFTPVKDTGFPRLQWVPRQARLRPRPGTASGGRLRESLRLPLVGRQFELVEIGAIGRLSTSDQPTGTGG